MNEKNYNNLLESAYNDCDKEYQIALLKLEKLISKTKDIYILNLKLDSKTKKAKKLHEIAINEIISVSKSLQDFNKFSDKTLSSLSNVKSMIESPNKNVKQMISNLKSDSSDLSTSTSSINIEKSDNVLEEAPCKNFNFSRSNLDHYFINYESDCIVSFVRNSKMFFLVDCRAKAVIMSNFFRNKPKRLTSIPSDNEIFGIYLDGYLFRAAKEKGISKNAKNFRIYLLDAGDIIPINFDEAQLYPLSKELQEIPGQAIFCTLDEVEAENVDYANYLEENIYTQQHFTIRKMRKNIFHVNLKPLCPNNPFYSDMEVNANNIENFSKKVNNPFLNYKCDFPKKSGKEIEKDKIFRDLHADKICEKPDLECNCCDYSKTVHNHPLRQEINCINMDKGKHVYDVCSDSDSLEDSFKYLSCSNKSKKISSNIHNINLSLDYNNHRTAIKDDRAIKHNMTVDNITTENLDMLYEEEPSTQNALQAVLGYTPKDDSKICKFYDPNTKSCFKGSRCKQQHHLPIQDGWTRDKIPTSISIRRTLEYPDIGDKIKIVPTHIININSFYGQLFSKALQTKDLNELNCKLNAEEYSSTYKMFDKLLPAEQDLVIALYEDNLWYRAKIINIYDEETVKVFFVDYGNCSICSIKDIRQWNSYFDYLPFQALHFYIDQIIPNKNKMLEGLELLKSLILNRPVDAIVTDNYHEIGVKLKDSQGNDVGEQLIKQKFAYFSQQRAIPKALNVVPG